MSGLLQGPTRRYRSLATLAFLCAALVTVPRSHAEEVIASWEPSGPTGGEAGWIIQDGAIPTRFYLSKDSGLFRSDDSGVTWDYVSANLKVAGTSGGGTPIQLGNNGTLFAWPELYKSIDGGLSWTRLSNPPRITSIDDLVITPAGIIATGRPGGLPCVEIWLSVDGAASWSLASTSDLCSSEIAVSPSDPNVVYVGHLNSLDGGRTWKDIGSFLVPRVVAWDAPKHLYHISAGSGSVKESTDGGDTWRTLNPIPGLDNSYGERYITTGQDGCLIVLGYEESPRSAVAASSCDNGLIWIMRYDFPATSWTGVVPDRANPETYLAISTPAGLLRSANSGLSWTPSNEGLFGATWSVTSSPFGSFPSLYASFRGEIAPRSNQQYGPVFRKNSQGWAEGGPLPNGGTSRIGLTPLTVFSDGTLFLALGECSTFCSSETTPHLMWKSSDRGATWTSSDHGIPVPYRNLSNDAGLLSVNFDDEGKSGLAIGIRRADAPIEEYERCDGPYSPYRCRAVFRTSDGGSHWEPLSLSGVPSTEVYLSFVAVDPSDSLHMILRGNDRRYYQSLDLGYSWRAVTEPWPLNIKFEPDGTMLGVDCRLSESRDRGQTWQTIHPGCINSVASAPYTPAMWTSDDSGVFETLDRGLSWHRLSTSWPVIGSQSIEAMDLFYDPHGRILFASTQIGLWQIDVAKDKVGPSAVIRDVRRAVTNAPFHLTAEVSIDDSATGASAIHKVIWFWEGSSNTHSYVLPRPISGRAELEFEVDVLDSAPQADAKLLVRGVDVYGNAGLPADFPFKMPKPPIYIALGDSYPSGHQGTSKCLPGTDTCVDFATEDDPTYGYPWHLKEKLTALGTSTWTYLYQNLAVSGSGTDAVMANQVSQAQHQLRLRPESWNIASLTAGANDTEWVDYMTAWFWSGALHIGCPPFIPVVQQKISNGVRDIVQQIGSADHDVSILVTGYPNPFLNGHKCFQQTETSVKLINDAVSNGALQVSANVTVVDYYGRFSSVSHPDPFERDHPCTEPKLRIPSSKRTGPFEDCRLYL